MIFHLCVDFNLKIEKEINAYVVNFESNKMPIKSEKHQNTTNKKNNTQSNNITKTPVKSHE